MSPFLGAAGAALLMVALPPHERASSHTAASSGHRFTLPVAPGLADASPPEAVAAPPAPTTDSVGVDLTGSSVASTSLNLGSSNVGSSFSPSSLPGSEAPPPGGFTMPGDQTVTADSSERTPFKIVAHGWATREAGTPLANEGVPDGTLPVGNRAGQVDKASYIKLSGNDLFLRLTEDSSGARNVAGAGGVQACEITANWTPSDAGSLDTAPPYDPKSCAPGKAGGDGTWKFDMGQFDNASSGNGFALVPTSDAPVDFQVAFKIS
jgi:hypothetical protein